MGGALREAELELECVPRGGRGGACGGGARGGVWPREGPEPQARPGRPTSPSGAPLPTEEAALLAPGLQVHHALPEQHDQQILQGGPAPPDLLHSSPSCLPACLSSANGPRSAPPLSSGGPRVAYLTSLRLTSRTSKTSPRRRAAAPNSKITDEKQLAGGLACVEVPVIIITL